MTKDRDPKTGRFSKGVSGNPNGRRKGIGNKKMTDAQLRDFLGRRTKHYLDQITKLATDNMTEDPALSFKCYQALLKADFDMRIGALKEQVKSPKKVKPEENKDNKPKVLSLASKN
jgi:hypothetical protein